MMYDIDNILLDRYKIFGYREGGMGIIYFVKDLLTGKHFAAKTYKADAAKKEKLAQRFQNELEFSLELEKHENLLTAHFIEKIDGRLFLFTDYVDGGEKGSTLAERIDDEEIDFESAISFGYQIAKGMAFLNHRSPVAHLDLKPSNILVTQDDIVKISDFGLARNAEPFQYRPSKENMGSWPYMSPEQFKGEFVDTRADIYAFGIIFYQMLTGKLPFDFEIEGKSKKEIYQFLKQFHNSKDLGETFYFKGLSEALHLNTMKSLIVNSGTPSRDLGGDLGFIIGGSIARDRDDRYRRFDDIVDSFKFAFAHPIFTRYQYDDLLMSKEEDHLQRGLGYQKLNQHSQALKYFNQALKKQPDEPMIWIAAAESLWHLNMNQEAERFLEKTISLAPQNIFLQKRIAAIQEKIKGG